MDDEAERLRAQMTLVHEHLILSVPIFEDERVSYVEVQIDRDDYAALIRLRGELDAERAMEKTDE